MKFATAADDIPAAGRPAKASATAGFTLAEVLAAMLFLALVIPAAVEALHVAAMAGEVAVRKSAAARVADRVLNESLVMTNWTGGTRTGTIDEGALEFHWTLTSQNWPQDAMQLLTAEVTFTTQSKPYAVKMWTLATVQTAPVTTTGMQP